MLLPRNVFPYKLKAFDVFIETNGIIAVIFVFPSYVQFETKMYRIYMAWIVWVLESKRAHRLMLIFTFNLVPKYLSYLTLYAACIIAPNHANYSLIYYYTLK